MKLITEKYINSDDITHSRYFRNGIGLIPISSAG